MQADRLAALGLPQGLHPDDAAAIMALLRLAEGRENGFETTVLARVFATEEDDDDRLVKVVVVGNERGATLLVGTVDDEYRFDPLTGLPGRDYTLDAIDDALQGTLDSNRRVGVFAIDVDRFKRVNDTLGYSRADEVLRVIAAELIAVLGPDDIVGRQGGDEFTVVCPDMLGVSEALTFGERFRSISSDVAVDSPLAGITLSIGIATGGPDRTAENLLREAETALYEAKALGRDRCEMFDDELRSESERRVSVDQRLREALDHDAIEVHFQPIVEIVGQRLVGAEALLRVEGADGAPIDPRELVHNAEDSGLIRQIEEQALEHAAAVVRQLPEGDEPVFLSVNVSNRRFNDSRFPLALARSLHRAGLSADRLRLEISPEILVGDPIGVRLVSQLRALGVGVTIDDFASPSESELLGPDGFDVVKLNRSVVQAVTTEQGRARAEVVVAGPLAQGADVCAVGVETQADLVALQQIGCRYAQGYLFSRPLTGAEFTDLVAETVAALAQPEPSAVGESSSGSGPSAGLPSTS